MKLNFLLIQKHLFDFLVVLTHISQVMFKVKMSFFNLAKHASRQIQVNFQTNTPSYKIARVKLELNLG